MPGQRLPFCHPKDNETDYIEPTSSTVEYVQAFSRTRQNGHTHTRSAPHMICELVINKRRAAIDQRADERMRGVNVFMHWFEAA